MFLFDLDMSSQRHSLRSALKKGILKNSAELTGKQLCAGVSFVMKVQTS